MIINNKRELWITRTGLTITLAICIMLFYSLAKGGYTAYLHKNTHALIATVVFAVALFFIAYGNILYQVCLIGYYKRRMKYRAATRDALNTLYSGDAPSLSILIPSYKEERKIIWQTLLSAALAEYPQKNVVLLIDDPYRAKALEDMLKLEETRKIPGELQQMFDAECASYKSELTAYKERRSTGKIYHGIELNRLSMLYDNAATWLKKLAVDTAEGKALNTLSHTDQFFIDAIILTPAQEHTALAEEFRQKIADKDVVCGDVLERHYARLAGLFNVNFSSFERKKYNNLSHEANKAMNLNSYISLIGKSWKEVEVVGGFELHEVAADEADFTISDSTYVNTIDADSLMLPDCVLRLIHVMQQPGNERLAVIQSPVSSVPGAQGLERAAGGCLDLQFFVHQGFSHWNASFWVGANAMLRRAALEDVRETRMEGKHAVSIYIQDRTVIEDTESSIDIVAKGWKLLNYPKRLSFSAMPSDFGSLLIQRRRWANGGLIILPKLFSYVRKAPKNMMLMKELFMRFHYLASTTTGCLVVPLLLLYPFGNNVSVGWLFSFSIMPGIVLYGRLLRLSGYNYADLMRIFAMNLMLVPVHTGGVLKQFQQMITGTKIPFGRTPKVSGRTSAPALYCLIEVVLTAGFLISGLMDMQKQHWVAASVSLLNGGLMLYALTQFIGIKAIVEDITIGLRTRLREASHQAEIIPLPNARWIANTLSTRKRAS